jgi:hypothetical protein
LHNARITKALHSTAHRRFRESYVVRNRAVRSSAVLLQVANYLAIMCVKYARRGVDELNRRTLFVRLTRSLWLGSWHWLFLTRWPKGPVAADKDSIEVIRDGMRRYLALK